MSISNSIGTGQDSAVTIRVPLALRRRGGRKLVVTPTGETWSPPPRPRIDDPLLAALVRAFHWKRLLDDGVHATIGDLAQSEGLNTSYVSHVLRLTLLSPTLVEAILEGRQPRTLQLQPIMRYLPDEWDRQAGNAGAEDGLDASRPGAP